MPEEKDVVTLMHEKEVNEDFEDWTHTKLKLKSKHSTANWSEADKKICMGKGSIAIKYFFESREVSRYIRTYRMRIVHVSVVLPDTRIAFSYPYRIACIDYVSLLYLGGTRHNCGCWDGRGEGGSGKEAVASLEAIGSVSIRHCIGHCIKSICLYQHCIRHCIRHCIGHCIRYGIRRLCIRMLYQ
jgi:hypothetical protein